MRHFPALEENHRPSDATLFVLVNALEGTLSHECPWQLSPPEFSPPAFSSAVPKRFIIPTWLRNYAY